MHLESNIINKVEEIRVSTDSNILNRQKHLIPSYIELFPQVVWDAYYIAGDRFTITGKFKFAMYVHNLPFNEDVISKREPRYFISTLDEMVKNNEIQPVLIFLKNKLIPWSKIRIVKDITTTYMMIENMTEWDRVDQIKCISFPFNISYIEKYDKTPSVTFLSFNSAGLFEPTSRHVVMYPNDPTMLMYIANYVGAGTDITIPIVTEKQYTISDKNFSMVFKNGELTDDYTIEISNQNIVSLRLNNGLDTDVIGFVFFCPINDNNINTNRHIFKVNNIINDERLFNKLDFKFDPNDSYEESINKALETIIRYDSDLMNSVYNKSSMITSTEYSGLEFLRLAKQGIVKFNENNKKIQEDSTEVLIRTHVIVFVNNLLYSNIHAMTIVNNEIRIPVNGISPTDKVEVLFFKEIINNTNSTNLSANVDEDGTIEYLSTLETLSELYESNYELYTRKPSDNAEVKMTSVDEFDRVQFKLNVKSIINKSNKLSFNISDDYTGIIPITLVSKRQFRHFGFYANHVGFNFQLSPEFNYCINKNQYLVFINGRKINQDNFILVSASPEQPFDDISIYMTFEFDIKDKVDVFYVPEVCHEFAMAPRIPTTGNIYLDRNNFDYGFNKEFFLIFINGKKIYNSQIKNINSSKIHIDSDINSVNDICILKYMNGIDNLVNLFKTGESEWDEITNTIEKDNLYKMLDLNNVEISDSEEDFNAWQVDATEINAEIARDYWLSSRIYNENTDVLYDYNDIELLKKDFFGAQITSLQNALVEYYRNHNENTDTVTEDEFTNTVTYK